MNDELDKSRELEKRIKRLEDSESDDRALLDGYKHFMFNIKNSDDGIKDYGENDINLRQVIITLWRQRFHMALIVTIFAGLSVVYAVLQPNVYKVTTILAPANEDAKSGLGALASQYGGIAAMAGIDLASSSDKQVDHALEFLQSWSFLDDFVNKYRLKPSFMATIGWDKSEDQLMYDENIYDRTNDEWVSIDGSTSEPSSYRTYKLVSEKIKLSRDSKSGLINLSVSHYSPNTAYDILSTLTIEINEHFRAVDQDNARLNIELLKAKISNTSNTEMRKIFYRMIENHSKTLLLTEVNEQYLFKTVVPPMKPERKDKPSRALLCILGTLLGVLVAILFALFNDRRIGKEAEK